MPNWVICRDKRKKGLWLCQRLNIAGAIVWLLLLNINYVYMRCIYQYLMLLWILWGEYVAPFLPWSFWKGSGRFSNVWTASRRGGCATPWSWLSVDLPQKQGAGDKKFIFTRTLFLDVGILSKQSVTLSVQFCPIARPITIAFQFSQLELCIQ